MNGIKINEWSKSMSSVISSSDRIGQASAQEAHNSYMLHVHVLKGCNLVARDSTGSSDPYVRIKTSDKVLFKTRKIFQNLNPVWNEHFECSIGDFKSELVFEVFDYDCVGKDDYMGSATVQLMDVKENQIREQKLMLKDTKEDRDMGYIVVNVSLTPMTAEEEAVFHAQRKTGKAETVKANGSASLKKFKKGAHAPVYQVTIVLAEGRNLIPHGFHKSHKTPPDPYVKLKIGSSKFRSKAASKTYSPRWLEQFEMRSYCQPDQQMELDVVNRRKEDMIGRCTVDLSKLPKNITNHCWYQLENGAGEILLLITLSPIKALSLDEQSLESKTSEDVAAVAEKYRLVSCALDDSISGRSLHRTFQKLTKTLENMADIGFLVVKVHKAIGLAAADIGSGKSDPFCVLELVNDRVQTSTVYKSLNPEWNQYFTFIVKDIHSVLEVTVYDEDPNSEPEFLGKVGIPLLNVYGGQKKWHALKDKHLMKRAKGQVLLETKLAWNPVRAAVRTFNPREPKYMAHTCHFQRKILVANLNRIKSYVAPLRDTGAYIQSCFSWESPPRSLIAFIAFLFVTYYWHVYMIPVAILSIFAWNYLSKVKEKSEDKEYIDSEDESCEEEETPNEADKNLSLTEKFRGFQDKLFELQDGLDFAASTVERMRNVFTFKQPFLSILAVVIFTAATIMLYFIPLRYLIMAWGINKFTKRFRKRKGFVPNNEVLDYLSRVFSDKETRMYGEFYVLQTPVTETLKK